MTDTSETHYARSADGTNLAYQVSGNGPLDLVFMVGGGRSICSGRIRRSSGYEGGWAHSAAPFGGTAGAWAHLRVTYGT